jgi:hypothetical protein
MNDVIENLRDKSVQVAVKNLMIYSLTILAVPLGTMFGLKALFFEGDISCFILTLISGLLGYDSSTAMMYSAVAAVIILHIILGFWIVAACKDETHQKKED